MTANQTPPVHDRSVAALIRDRMVGLADILKDIRKNLRVKKMDAISLESIAPGTLPADIPPESFTTEPSLTNLERTQVAIVASLRAMGKELFATLHAKASSIVARYQILTDTKTPDLARRIVTTLYKLKDILDDKAVAHELVAKFNGSLERMDAALADHHADALVKTYYSDTPLRRYLVRVSESLADGQYFDAIQKHVNAVKTCLENNDAVVTVADCPIIANAEEAINAFRLPERYNPAEVAKAIELLVERLKADEQPVKLEFSARVILDYPLGIDYGNRVKVHADKLQALVAVSEITPHEATQSDVGDVLRLYDSILMNLEFLENHENTMSSVTLSVTNLCQGIIKHAAEPLTDALAAYYVLVGAHGADVHEDMPAIKEALEELLILVKFLGADQYNF